MAIVTNNNNLGTAIDNLYTGHGIPTSFFTVTVKDSSANAIDLRAHDDASGNFHKGGLVEKLLGLMMTRGTIAYWNVKDAATGVITVGMEGEFATATNLALVFDNNNEDGTAYADGTDAVPFRATASSTSDDAVADVSGTTVAADTLV